MAILPLKIVAKSICSSFFYNELVFLGGTTFELILYENVVGSDVKYSPSFSLTVWYVFSQPVQNFSKALNHVPGGKNE